MKGRSKPKRSKLATSKGPSELMDTSGSHDPLYDDGASRDDDAEGHFKKHIIKQHNVFVHYISSVLKPLHNLM